MDDVLSYSDFFFLAASLQSKKINSPYMFALVHTFHRGWRIFQRRHRRQTVTVIGRSRQEELGPDQMDVVGRNEDAALHKRPEPDPSGM